jgi:tRNA(Ile)-lysidine synthase
VAFSGGPDSVGLAASLAHLDPLLGYVDHGLRDWRDRKAERRRVREVAGRLGLELRRVRVSPASRSEAAARFVRYRALEVLCRKHGCSGIATAHTADDRAETVLFNLLRGVGLRGLAAPRPHIRIHGVARLRPALDERRDELRRRAEPFEPVEDRTNRSTAFARSRIRHQTLPALGRILGQDPVPLLCTLADAAERVRAELEERALDLADRALRTDLLREPAPTFAYLVEALRPPGPPLNASAYEALRAFLVAGRGDRAHRTPGGESWRLEKGGTIRVKV